MKKAYIKDSTRKINNVSVARGIINVNIRQK
jgi:hypothetical protein